MSLWTFLYDMMKCRVSGTQWTITFSPTKLVSGASQWVTPGLFLSSSNSHTPAPSLCPLCHDNALLCITSWIGSWLRLTLGNALFVIKPTDGCLCLMGSHYIHHFTRTRLCNTFLTCSSPLTPDDGVKRASCPGEREPVWLSPCSQLHVRRLLMLILYQMSERVDTLWFKVEIKAYMFQWSFFTM